MNQRFKPSSSLEGITYCSGELLEAGAAIEGMIEVRTITRKAKGNMKFDLMVMDLKSSGIVERVSNWKETSSDDLNQNSMSCFIRDTVT
jgi:hypothetical protein